MKWKNIPMNGWYVPILFILINYSCIRNKDKNTDSFIKKEDADSLAIMAMIHQADTLKNEDSVTSLLNRALSLSRAKNFNCGIGAALLNLGSNMTAKAEYKESIRLLNEAYPFCIKASNKRNMLSVLWYNDMAVPYSYMGQSQKAIEFYYKALAELERINPQDSDYKSLIYGNIGGLWLEMEEYNKGLYYLKLAETFATKNSYLDVVYINMADIYIHKGALNEATEYANKLLMYGKETGNYGEIKDAYITLGNLATIKKQYEDAIVDYKKAIEINNKIKFQRSIVGAYSSLGKLYLKKKEYSKANYYAELGLKNGIATNELEGIVACYDVLLKINEAKGNYLLAFKYQKKYVELHDSLMNTEKVKNANSLEVKYRVLQKDKEIAQNQMLVLKQKVQLKNKNIWIGGVVSGLLLFILGAVYLYKINKHKQRLQAEQINTLQQEQEISKLKATIEGEEKERARMARELHDGVVSQLVAVKLNLDHLRKRKVQQIDPIELEDAFQQIEETTIELRKTAHNLLPDILIQSGLEIALNLFCEKIRKSSALDIRFEAIGIIPRLHPDIELTLYRTIQELVQNVLKHARATQSLVQLIYQEGLLSITVEDNGMGYTQGTVMTANSGLNNIHERVKSLNGSIEVSSHCSNEANETSGTTVYMEFDILKLTKDKIYGNKISNH